MESLRVLDALAVSSGGIGKRRQQLQRQALRCSRGTHEIHSSSSEGLWERLQQAWGVLLGSSTSASSSRNGRRRMKKRFTRLLVTERGFEADRLNQFYELVIRFFQSPEPDFRVVFEQAKAAVSQHVILEDGDEQGMATVERLGELQFQFNVKRIRSSAQEEPGARPTLIEYDPDNDLR